MKNVINTKKLEELGFSEGVLCPTKEIFDLICNILNITHLSWTVYAEKTVVFPNQRTFASTKVLGNLYTAYSIRNIEFKHIYKKEFSHYNIN